MPDLHEIGTLWIGERLSFLEHLCLKSFLDRGHEVTLYSYAPVQNVPDGILLGDAQRVLEDEDIMIHKERNSPAIHSDLFRVRMVRNSDLVWVDCDAYCLKPFKKVSPWILAYDSPKTVANSVLGAPRDASFLAELDEFLSSRGASLPWWNEKTKAEHFGQYGTYDFGDMKWASTGPDALTWFLRKTGEIEHALPKPVLYPLPSKRKTIVLRRPAKVFEHISPETISIHFYGTRLREILRSTPVPENSFLGHLAKEHKVPLPGAA